MKSKKIRGPVEVIKRYLLYDWLYYFTPFVVCFVYGIFTFDFKSMQMLVNSFYQNIFNLAAAIGLFISIPNMATLIHCQKKVLQDMPKDIILKAASSERAGGAGCGKTSSAGLQAIFEATEMEHVCTLNYYYIKSNYRRWAAENPRKLKDFAELEKSIMFWRNHPEYIPFLGSNVTLFDANGRRSFYVDGEALAQKVWIPTMFILIDEAGNELPQEMYKERPAGPTMFARYIRHFGFRMSLLEQKLDGIYINVRSVLGVRCLALGQSNKLLPYLLIDIKDYLKRRLGRLDADEATDISSEKKEKMQQRFERLGHFIEKLESFSMKLGFRIWEEAIIPPEAAANLIQPEMLKIYCTNTMPVLYDDREFSKLYIAASDDEADNTDYPTRYNKSGMHILNAFYEQERLAQVDKVADEAAELKAKNDLLHQQQRASSLAKKQQQLEAAKNEDTV